MINARLLKSLREALRNRRHICISVILCLSEWFSRHYYLIDLRFDQSLVLSSSPFRLSRRHSNHFFLFLLFIFNIMDQYWMAWGCTARLALFC